MILPIKIAIAMTLLAFVSFFVVLGALHVKSKVLFILGWSGCVVGVVVGVITIFISIWMYVRPVHK